MNWDCVDPGSAEVYKITKENTRYFRELFGRYSPTSKNFEISRAHKQMDKIIDWGRWQLWPTHYHWSAWNSPDVSVKTRNTTFTDHPGLCSDFVNWIHLFGKAVKLWLRLSTPFFPSLIIYRLVSSGFWTQTRFHGQGRLHAVVIDINDNRQS